MQSVWIVLAIMGYLMVTCVLSILAAARKRAVDVHDRLRQCMELRRQFANRQSLRRLQKPKPHPAG